MLNPGGPCRKDTKAKPIDKIFVSPKILDIGLEVQVLDSVEVVATETNGLGHKGFLISIDEKLTEPKMVSTFMKKVFAKKVYQKFTDTYTNEISAEIGREPLQPTEYLPNEKFEPMSMCAYKEKFNDPAALLTNTLVDLVETATKRSARKEPLQFQDLIDNATNFETDAVKKFSRMGKQLLSSICSENPLLTHSIDIEEKPPLEDLSKTLSKKLNKCHRGDLDFFDDFVNNFPTKHVVPYSPNKITMEELNKALSNIRPTKTPWLRGIAPFHVIEATKASVNFKKLLLILLNRCLLSGMLASTMNHDSVVFLYKKGDRKDPSNYRPISIDHPFCKILCEILNKKVIYRMNIYRNPLNFSYEAGKSTMTAVLTASLITEEIRGRGNIPLIICTDMSGAFETTQSLLIEKCLENTISDNLLKSKETLINYMRQKVIYAKKENDDIIEIFRKDKLIGSGQGSKASPNLFLIQASCATYGLKCQKLVLLTKINGKDIFALVYADDNFSILELLPELQPGIARLTQVRQVVKIFMETWEFEVKMAGMIINETKTEVLAVDCPPDDSVYPPIKKTIKWLGIFLTMSKNFTLIADTDANIKHVKTKTWDKFTQLCYFTSHTEVKLRMFTMFIEPVLNYALADAITAGPKKFNATVKRFQVLQNDYLRNIAKTGYYSSINELHDVLGIRSVESKIKKVAWNEWQKVRGLENFKPESRSSRQGEIFIINSIKSNFWQIQNSFDLHAYSEQPTKFDLDKFTKWKKVQDAKRLSLLKNAAPVSQTLAPTQSQQVTTNNIPAQTQTIPTNHNDYMANAFTLMASTISQQ